MLIKTRIDRELSRTDRELSITQRDLVPLNGRGEVGNGVRPSKGEREISETKLGTAGVSHKRRLLENQPQMVEFYGKLRREEEVERIRPLVVGRRINADSWKLYEEAFERLMLKGIPVWGGREEDLEVEEGKEKPLVGEKLLRLIKFLYSHKFHQVDLRKKPTMGWVLKQTSVEKLDLGGWGRYAVPVYEVLLELGLIDETTEVRFPKNVPVVGGKEETTDVEIDLFDPEWEEIEEEATKVEEEEEPFEVVKGMEPAGEVEIGEPLEGEKDELYNLLFGDWEEETTDEGDKEIEPPGGDDDDELYRLLFGED